jgi:hypothetical protein
MIGRECRGVGMTWLLVLLLSALLTVEAGAALECYDCHGSRSQKDIRPYDAPVREPGSGGFPGNHRTHLTAGATVSDCAACHPGSETYGPGHRDGRIAVSSRLNSSPVITPYKNLTTSSPRAGLPLHSAAVAV